MCDVTRLCSRPALEVEQFGRGGRNFCPFLLRSRPTKMTQPHAPPCYNLSATAPSSTYLSGHHVVTKRSRLIVDFPDQKKDASIADTRAPHPTIRELLSSPE